MTITSYSFPIHPYWIDYSDLYIRADAISHAYHSGNLVFLLGSGASKAYSSAMPNWNELLVGLLSDIKLQNAKQKEEITEHIKNQQYLLAAEAVKKFGDYDTDNKDLAVDELVGKIIKQRTNYADENPILHLSILDFGVPIITTNFDTIIEDLIAEHKVPGYKPSPITYEDQDDVASLLNPTRMHENYVFKLHGSIHKIQRLILDENDYADFYFHRKWSTSLQLLRHVLATKMVIFVGFSLSDPEIMPILREATRYSSSYQHIALMHERSLTAIQKDSLRSNYKVDPITYEEHEHLPLYIMEMRNFYHREDIALHLKPKKKFLLDAINLIKSEAGLPELASAILFGSYAKYGDLAQQDADVDILFVVPYYYSAESHFYNSNASKAFGKKMDITVMRRDELEELLKVGDAFASSILVTGCPLQDPNDTYGILCRGFRGNYVLKEVVRNSLERYETRWIRLCLLETVETQEYLQALHQWSIGVMQLFLVRDYYPLDSLLSVSLLGNARYVIREFTNHYSGFDEDYFMSIMRDAKGMNLAMSSKQPDMIEAIMKLWNALKGKHSEEDLSILFPGKYIPKSEPKKLWEDYKSLENYLAALSKGETSIALGYGGITDTEKSLITEMKELYKKSNGELSVFDYLFFIRLHNHLKQDGISAKEAKAICKKVKGEWLQYIEAIKVQVEKD